MKIEYSYSTFNPDQVITKWRGIFGSDRKLTSRDLLEVCCDVYTHRNGTISTFPLLAPDFSDICIEALPGYRPEERINLSILSSQTTNWSCYHLKQINNQVETYTYDLEFGDEIPIQIEEPQIFQLIWQVLEGHVNTPLPPCLN